METNQPMDNTGKPGNTVNTEVTDKDIFNAGDHTKTENNTTQNPFSKDTGSTGSSGSTNNTENTDFSKKTENSETKVGNKTNLGALISGKAAVEFTNIIVPSGTTFIMRKAGYEFDKKELQFSANEKEILSPYFQEWLNSLNIDLNNPFYNLLIGLSIVYSSKFMDKGGSIKAIKKEKKVLPTTDPTIERVKKEYQTTKARETVDKLSKMASSVPMPNASQIVQESFEGQQWENEEDKENANLFEQMMKEEDAQQSPEYKKQLQLIKDVVKVKGLSRAKAIEFLIGKGKLPIDFIDPKKKFQ